MTFPSERPAARNSSRKFPVSAIIVIFLLSFLIPIEHVDAQTNLIGYIGPSFPAGAGGNSQPTGEKPESKLWWNDGFWYGIMWSEVGNAYHIYRLNLPSQEWVDTGTAVDNRLESRADALWDGQKLYVVSHIFDNTGGEATPPAERGRLYRFSYNSSLKNYSLDGGFPVVITGGKSETLVIDKDSSGQLWVTYVQDRKVMINHSINGDDRTWGTPYVLPAGGFENVAADDISALITYNNHVGVMWSNQNREKTMYFAVHPVGSPDQNWTRVRAYAISGDDHINLKTLQSDNAGNIFAVVKTAQPSALIVVLVCKNNLNRCRMEDDWSAHTVYNTDTNNPTRPLLLIDETNRHLYVFTRNDNPNGIYYKRTNLDNISFPGGIGTPFIRGDRNPNANDVTSTKQNLNAATGLVVLASDKSNRVYLHNYLALPGSAVSPAPTIISVAPASGPPGTEVTITGTNLTNVYQVLFNSTPSLNFTVDSATRLRAVVPPGATSGPVTLNGSYGTASGSGFIVEPAPQSRLFLSVLFQSVRP